MHPTGYCINPPYFTPCHCLLGIPYFPGNISLLITLERSYVKRPYSPCCTLSPSTRGNTLKSITWEIFPYPYWGIPFDSLPPPCSTLGRKWKNVDTCPTHSIREQQDQPIYPNPPQYGEMSTFQHF